MVGGTEQIGRYRIEGEAGVGGFSTVYRAHDPLLERTVALKVLHPHLARDPATRDSFLAEGRSLARVEHPNVVRVLDAGESDGAVYLAMEFVDGQPLTARPDGRPLSLSKATAIAEQLAAALGAIHALGLVHCDVKPANILIERRGGRVVLLDFGVARTVDQTLTAGGWVVGTPAYMAPEQVEPGGRVSPRTDVYQMGATLYALLAGRAPFAGEAVRTLLAVTQDAPADLGTLRPDLPPAAVRAIHDSLSKDPAERPADPAALVRRLRAASTDDNGVTRRLLAPVRGARTAPAPAARPATAPLR
jgi:eukaryotic-like serine/threonine-protein kinase